ncbi:AAA family ATPase [Chondromyces apiculatus]|uniref:AAA family ATPase n=1 Tax=Chondromyces apiculatus TaxID=51 RepID=UPI0018CC5A2E|nr:ATP-binding protein [Chondromyces apiculatus]
MPLRPLTLLYGRNNAGKNAVARALAIFGASLAENTSSALVIPPEILREGSFKDLAWRGDAGDYSFDLGLRWDAGQLREARYTLDSASSRPAYIKELRLRDEDGTELWAGVTPPDRPMRPQSGHVGEDVSFEGLLPQDPKVPILRELADRLADLQGRIRWLGGLRTRQRRLIERGGGATLNLNADGSNAASFLIERPHLLADIKDFYAELTPARDLEVKEVLNLGHRITLNLKNQATFDIDLVDTGEGMAQVLPVLVAAALAKHEEPGALLVVEEPENQLHPDAQALLARHLCRIAARPAPPTLVMETHSQAFLLGVQLAVAKGLLPAERVGLVWVDQDANGRSTITSVDLESSGHPRAGWPVTALATELLLASELAEVNLKRAGDP